MKWIGQHIWDFISRFRSDVYLEATESGTIASGGNLGLDSNNKIVKADTNAGELSITNAGDNRVVTSSGGTDLNAESSFSYNSGGILGITSALGPSLSLYNTGTTSAVHSIINFVRTDTTGADGHELGLINFWGYDEGGGVHFYAQIESSIVDASPGAEEGQLTISVASHDGELQPGLIVNSGDAEDKVNVTIANGAASVTTITGTLTMGSTAAMTNAGLLSVAAQTNVTSLGTLTGLTTSGAIELGHATDTTLARSAAGIATIEGKQIFTTNTPALTSAAAGVPAVTMQVRRTITTAEANAMNSTPIVLVPAQGANTVIVPLGGMVRVDRAANQTNASADWNVHYEDDEPGIPAATSLMHIRRFMYGQGNDTIYHVIPSMIYNETGQALTKDVDKDMEVSFDAATTTDCFTSIEVFLTYQVFNIS